MELLKNDLGDINNDDAIFWTYDNDGEDHDTTLILDNKIELDPAIHNMSIDLNPTDTKATFYDMSIALNPAIDIGTTTTTTTITTITITIIIYYYH